MALHRVAYLAFHNPQRFNSRRSLVVVFNRALAAYVSQVLPALGVEGVRVRTYPRWVGELRRRHFPRLPRRYNDDTPAAVTQVKLSSAMIPIMQAAAARYPTGAPLEVFDDLFTSRSWLDELLDQHAPGRFNTGQIEDVHRWCTRQHFNREDGGDGDHEKPALDPEDDTLLLYLHQLLEGPLRLDKRRPLEYAHLVVDEVQDLSPIELTVLLQTAHRNAPITLAGDTAQKIVEDRDFESWQQTLELLNLDHVAISPLEISYRSTRQIMELAQQVLGPLAPEEPPNTPRDGAPVELFVFGSKGEAATFLTDVLRDLVTNEPTASVALLARYPEQAEEVYGALRRSEIPNLKRVRDQDFSFAPGIEVTDIRQAKGLEFDYVIMLDCDQATYPDNGPSRHLMHVGVTRTAHQCWLLCTGRPSPIIPASLVRAST